MDTLPEINPEYYFTAPFTCCIFFFFCSNIKHQFVDFCLRTKSECSLTSPTSLCPFHLSTGCCWVLPTVSRLQKQQFLMIQPKQQPSQYTYKPLHTVLIHWPFTSSTLASKASKLWLKWWSHSKAEKAGVCFDPKILSILAKVTK